jgi:glutamate synthase (NADPH/NADH) large chain
MKTNNSNPQNSNTATNKIVNNTSVRPQANGLYHPDFEHENCGVGFIAHLKKQASHEITTDALEMLTRMDHRGGCGCEENTGDGAGIMTNISDDFFIPLIKEKFNTEVKHQEYAIGNVFLPHNAEKRAKCHSLIQKVIAEYNQEFIDFRTVPVDFETSDIGKGAFDCMPIFEQIIIKKSANSSAAEFEKALFIIRKFLSRELRAIAVEFYISSLSNQVIVYKGMLMGSQVLDFYKDLQSPNYKTYFAMVHSRFSTNTFPSWDRSQPCRYMSHNGEINTRSGNYNWMVAREGTLDSEVLGTDLNKTLPVIEPDVSDSGSFDNVLEFLMANGRTLAEAVLMMVPQAWQNDEHMSDDKKAFYKYFANIMEPWDGPASISFADGHQIGAVLDRNGLRPSRYYETFDGRIIMASEIGTVDVPSENVKSKGRLQPGKIFLVDFDKGEMIDDETIKTEFASKNPYGEWIKENQIYIDDLTTGEISEDIDLKSALKTFGYSTERMEFMLKPLVTDGRDPVGSMGNDTALSCMSEKPRLIYDYFKQCFAQVTNPAIDSIREEVVMSLKTSIGPSGNLLKNTPENAKRLVIESPVLSNENLAKIRNQDIWNVGEIDITYEVGTENIQNEIKRICKKSEDFVKSGKGFIILSDKNISQSRAPISPFLVASAIHQHLIQTHLRTQTSIIVESGEVAEVHHFCLLNSFGADAVNPYLAFATLFDASENGTLDKTNDEIVAGYIKSVNKGMLKVMAKMGVSTLESYKGAQIFEAVGIASEVMETCFTGTQSRIGGSDFNTLQTEVEARHKTAFDDEVLGSQGQYHWRSGGEVHMWEPQVIADLQLASKLNDKDKYKAFAKRTNEELTRNATLRGLMDFTNLNPISVDEVEPVSEIVKRFATGAMSFGSISKESHESLAIAMNKLGGKSNTGEGGEDKSRWTKDANGDDRKSAIKQVASGRFGVSIDYLNQAGEIQIKVTQGAKPGEGGELPGKKVDEVIARTRNSTKGVGLISPPPHHDIYSIEDLSQLIFDLKRSNPAARISVKLVAGTGVGTIAAGVAKAKADHIVIAGHDGGTGASPITSIKHAGLPWELGLAETHQTLVMNDLRSRVVIQTDGQLKTGRDVAVAALLGAEEFGFSTAPLITLGCIMMRKCHLNTCPVGIATQDKELRAKFNGKPEYVINYLFMVAEELREIMAELGFKTVNDMIGRVDKLKATDTSKHYKQKNIDLSAMLQIAEKPHKSVGTYKQKDQDHGLELQIDNSLIIDAKNFESEKIVIDEKITNVDRAVGAMLSSFVVKKTGNNELTDNQITVNFNGYSGQSFGAFLAKGISFNLNGDANDYVGKGLSGGIIAVHPPLESKFEPSENIIAGNVCGYGATGGEMYLSGIVAERFCVRNSGALAVCEGVGDHALEYMTGGIAVILGETGKNLGAGMSGGIAYIYNPNNTLKDKINPAGLDLDKVENGDELKAILQTHAEKTNSKKAQNIFDNFDTEVKNFVKIVPQEYKKALGL